jgi:peptide/nickel transport system permease protein
VLAICFLFVPSFYRIVRGGVIQIRGREYVIWARLAGIGRWRVLLLHVLPNLVSPLIVMTSLTIAQAVLTETALTYLGLGVQPPDPSWGQMLSEAQRNILSAPWEAVSVGACVSAMALGFNLLGDGLRDLLDVRSV